MTDPKDDEIGLPEKETIQKEEREKENSFFNIFIALFYFFGSLAGLIFLVYLSIYPTEMTRNWGQSDYYHLYSCMVICGFAISSSIKIIMQSVIAESDQRNAHRSALKEIGLFLLILVLSVLGTILVSK